MNISIVTVTFNCGDPVLDCLDSVLTQSHNHTEHVLVDGASNDGTIELLQGYSGRANLRAALVSEPDQGIYDALNKGLARATGEVVGLLHGDDAFADAEVLAAVAGAFSDPNVQVVYGDLEYVSQERPNQVIRYWRAGPFSPARLRYGWMPPHPTFFLRRSLYERYGAFDTSYRIAADYDFMLRVLKHLTSDEVVYIPRVFTRMRTGGTSNRSLSNIARKSREDYWALRSNGIGGVGTLLLKNARKLPQFWQRSSS
jgi:glycosyltransferase